jgi:hypothetical protein
MNQSYTLIDTQQKELEYLSRLYKGEVGGRSMVIAMNNYIPGTKTADLINKLTDGGVFLGPPIYFNNLTSIEEILEKAYKEYGYLHPIIINRDKVNFIQKLTKKINLKCKNIKIYISNRLYRFGILKYNN